MGTAYNLSQQFYEAQYRDKLKELEVEKKKRKTVEDKVDEMESNIIDIMEENVKLKDELKECIADNNLLTQSVQ